MLHLFSLTVQNGSCRAKQFLAATFPHPSCDRNRTESHRGANAKTRERTSLGHLENTSREFDFNSSDTDLEEKESDLSDREYYLERDAKKCVREILRSNTEVQGLIRAASCWVDRGKASQGDRVH
jgi:hypothetical protein